MITSLLTKSQISSLLLEDCRALSALASTSNLMASKMKKTTPTRKLTRKPRTGLKYQKMKTKRLGSLEAFLVQVKVAILEMTTFLTSKKPFMKESILYLCPVSIAGTTWPFSTGMTIISQGTACLHIPQRTTIGS